MLYQFHITIAGTMPTREDRPDIEEILEKALLPLGNRGIYLNGMAFTTTEIEGEEAQALRSPGPDRT